MSYPLGEGFVFVGRFQFFCTEDGRSEACSGVFATAADGGVFTTRMAGLAATDPGEVI